MQANDIVPNAKESLSKLRLPCWNHQPATTASVPGERVGALKETKRRRCAAFFLRRGASTGFMTLQCGSRMGSATQGKARLGA